MLGRQFRHTAQAAGLDRIGLERIAVVPEPRHPRRLARIDDAVGPDQFQQHVLRIAPQRRRDFRHHGLHGESMRDVGNRAEPADARVCHGAAAFTFQVRDVERVIDQPHAEFERCGMIGARFECGSDRRCHAAMPPRRYFAIRIYARIDPFHRDGVVEVVPNVVLTRPGELDRRADRFRHQSGFQHVIPL